MEMERDTLLKAIAPCAFCCFTCAAMQGGVIEETSKKLNHYLAGYYEFGKKNLPFKYRSYNKKIKILTEQLEKMSSRPCGGCRSGADERCCIPNCFIPECARQHKVDFCAECDAFPCAEATAFFKGPNLKEWKLNNERIRQSSAEAYYEYALSRSHYIPFKD